MMETRFFCPRWGHAHLSWEVFAAQVKAAGYDGIETDLPEQEAAAQDLLRVLARNDLLLVAQHWETIDTDFDLHQHNYTKRLRRLASVRPLFINSQTGRDFFTAEQNERLLSCAADIAASTGIPVYHETHRGKFSFAAHITAAFLEREQALQLTLDISHWMAVAETYLYDQSAAIGLAIGRTRHVHARVGYTQGPQVPDPRAPEWQEALRVHLEYWDRVVAVNRQAGESLLTFTSEFGPPPYMQLLPHSARPPDYQWELNIFMMNLLKKRYNEL